MNKRRVGIRVNRVMVIVMVMELKKELREHKWTKERKIRNMIIIKRRKLKLA